MTRPATLAVALLLSLACAPVALAVSACTEVAVRLRLPDRLDETSGVAVGKRDPAVLWSHNDDGSRLFAVDTVGALLGSVRIRPRLRDWEDMAAGACPTHGRCLYLADTGDNAEQRRPGTIKLVRIAEPELPLPEGPLEGEVFPLRLPDGPRDIEALFVLPGERVYLVTKGRAHPPTVYRYPGALRPDTVTLEEVQRFGDGPRSIADQVTGAAASPDGDRVALRTYQSLQFHRVDGDTLVPRPDTRVNLRPLREGQGEGVAIGPSGMVVLTSEAGFFGGAPSMNRLSCRF